MASWGVFDQLLLVVLPYLIFFHLLLRYNSALPADRFHLLQIFFAASGKTSSISGVWFPPVTAFSPCWRATGADSFLSLAWFTSWWFRTPICGAGPRWCGGTGLPVKRDERAL